jgi:SAM-dependent methyltransferase
MKEYSNRFAASDAVSSYDHAEYAPDGYAALIWELQKPFLRGILAARLEETGSCRLLDFACGTGRVLGFCEEFCSVSDGLDISGAMIGKAEARCRQSRLVVGDICTEAILLEQPYDVITSFRFLLNAEPPLRVAVLEQLRKRIHGEQGILIVNIHGNSASARHFPLLLRRFRARVNPAKHQEVMMAEMSLAESRVLLRDAGFRVIREIGFGVVPSFLYRSMLKPICHWIDRRLCGSNFFKSISTDVIFVCEPI